MHPHPTEKNLRRSQANLAPAMSSASAQVIGSSTTRSIR